MDGLESPDPATDQMGIGVVATTALPGWRPFAAGGDRCARPVTGRDAVTGLALVLAVTTFAPLFSKDGLKNATDLAQLPEDL